jgi:hypothetical protein
MENYLLLRSVVIKTGLPVSKSKAYFHRWCREPFYNDLGRLITKTFALIEYEDGIVELVDPTFVKFSPPYSALQKSAQLGNEVLQRNV